MQCACKPQTLIPMGLVKGLQGVSGYDAGAVTEPVALPALFLRLLAMLVNEKTTCSQGQLAVIRQAAMINHSDGLP